MAANFGSETKWQTSLTDGWRRLKAQDAAGLRPNTDSCVDHNYLYFNKGNAEGEATLTSKAFMAHMNSKFSFDCNVVNDPQRKDIYGDHRLITVNPENAEHFCNEEGYLGVKSISTQCLSNVNKVVNYKNGFWESSDTQNASCVDVYQAIECTFN